MVYGQSGYGAAPYGAAAAEKVVVAIEKSELLPPDAKEAIRDFINESVQQLWRTLEELLSVSPPEELSEYWEIVTQIIQALL